MLTMNITQIDRTRKSKKRSKLLLVDLAGSERIKRTISQDIRLREAQSINSSLAALGNVIAALAKNTSRHVPFRDSKLTRLLQDSLGGTASTALIATVGPAPINESGSLSTLQFASRCMQVKSVPVQHEEVDYADLCTKLQTQLNSKNELFAMQRTMERERYEGIIHKLAKELRSARGTETPRSSASTPTMLDQGINNIKFAVEGISGKAGWDAGKKSHEAVLMCIGLVYKMLCDTYDQCKIFLKSYEDVISEKDGELQVSFERSVCAQKSPHDTRRKKEATTC